MGFGPLADGQGHSHGLIPVFLPYTVYRRCSLGNIGIRFQSRSRKIFAAGLLGKSCVIVCRLLTAVGYYNIQSHRCCRLQQRTVKFNIHNGDIAVPRPRCIGARTLRGQDVSVLVCKIQGHFILRVLHRICHLHLHGNSIVVPYRRKTHRCAVAGIRLLNTGFKRLLVTPNHSQLADGRFQRLHIDERPIGRLYLIIVVKKKRALLPLAIRSSAHRAGRLEPGIFVDHTPYGNTADPVPLLFHAPDSRINILVALGLSLIFRCQGTLGSVVRTACGHIQLSNLYLTHHFAVSPGRRLKFLYGRRAACLVMPLHSHSVDSGSFLGLDILQKLYDTASLVHEPLVIIIVVQFHAGRHVLVGIGKRI